MIESFGKAESKLGIAFVKWEFVDSQKKYGMMRF